MGSASRLAVTKSFIQPMWGSFWCLVTGVSSFRTNKMAYLHHVVFYNTCWKWHLAQARKWEAVMQPLTLPWWRLNMTATQINTGTIISLQWISLTHGLAGAVWQHLTKTKEKASLSKQREELEGKGPLTTERWEQKAAETRDWGEKSPVILWGLKLKACEPRYSRKGSQLNFCE